MIDSETLCTVQDAGGTYASVFDFTRRAVCGSNAYRVQRGLRIASAGSRDRAPDVPADGDVYPDRDTRRNGKPRADGNPGADGDPRTDGDARCDRNPGPDGDGDGPTAGRAGRLRPRPDVIHVRQRQVVLDR